MGLRLADKERIMDFDWSERHKPSPLQMFGRHMSNQMHFFFSTSSQVQVNKNKQQLFQCHCHYD